MACLPRTPRAKEAGLAALEAGRRATIRATAKPQPQTRLWEKAARNVAMSSAVTPPSTPPGPGGSHPLMGCSSPAAAVMEAASLAPLEEPSQGAALLQSDAANTSRSVFDILPIGRRCSESREDGSFAAASAGQPGQLAARDAVRTHARYVSSDPLASNEGKVYMSVELRRRLCKLVPGAVEARREAVAATSVDKSAAIAGERSQTEGGAAPATAQEIELTGVRLMEVGGSELQAVVVPASSVSERKLSGGEEASLHARLQTAARKHDPRNRVRTLPLPAGGSLKELMTHDAAKDDKHEQSTKVCAPHEAPPLPPPHVRFGPTASPPPRAGLKALPSTPKDQSPLRTIGGDAFALETVAKRDEGVPAAMKAMETPCSKALKALAREMLGEDGCAQTPGSSTHMISLDATADTPGTQLLQEMRREARDMTKGHTALVLERDSGRALAQQADEILVSVAKILRTSPALAVSQCTQKCAIYVVGD